jgi:hypothetical protein
MASNARTSVARKQELPRVLWWSRELFAITLWVAAIAKFFVYDFDIYLANRFAPNHAWLLQYKFFGVVAFIAVFALLATQRWFRSLFLHVVFYPFIVLVYLVILCCWHWPVVIAFAPGIHSFVRLFQTHLVWISVAILAGFAISVFTTPWLIVASMILLSAFLMRHYWYDFRRAFVPSGAFTDLAKIAQSFYSYQKESLARGCEALSTIDQSSEEFNKNKQKLLLNTFISNSLLIYVTEKFQSVAKSRLIELYLIFTVLFSLFVTLTVFGFLYLGLSKVDAGAFSPSSLGIWEAIGFSVNTMTTASVSHVSAQSALAQVACYAEILFGLLLVVITFAMLVGVVRERYREDLQKMIDELDATDRLLSETIRNEFEMTYDDLEEYLIESSLDTINGLRWLRGLKELPKPETPPPTGAAS